MRSKRFILGLLCVGALSLTFLVIVDAQPFETIEISVPGNSFSHPVWSPDGSKLAFWGKDGIYVSPSDGSGEPTKVIDTFGQDLMWASDSELVYWQRKITKIPQEAEKPKKITTESVRIVILNGQERVIKEAPQLSVLVQLHDGTIGFWEGDAILGNPFVIVKKGRTGETAPSKLIRVISHFPTVWDPQTKKPKYDDSDVWIVSLDGSFKKRVTYEKCYYFPRFSPDGAKILADFAVLDLNGNELANVNPGVMEISEGIFALAPASDAKWSPDSKKIAYCLVLENDRKGEVTGSDIYTVKVDGTERMQITDTPTEIEKEAVWSPDGNKLACYSQNTGKVFIIRVK